MVTQEEVILCCGDPYFMHEFCASLLKPTVLLHELLISVFQVSHLDAACIKSPITPPGEITVLSCVCLLCRKKCLKVFWLSILFLFPFSFNNFLCLWTNFSALITGKSFGRGNLQQQFYVYFYSCCYSRSFSKKQNKLPYPSCLFCGSNRTFLLNFSVLNYSLQYHISILTIYKQSYRCVCTDFDMDIEDRTQSYYRSNWLCVLAKLCWKKPENITVPLPFPPLSLNKINILSDQQYTLRGF